MKTPRPWLLALKSAPLLLLAGVFLVFGSLSPRFFQTQNLVNILVQSSSTAIVAIGMTFVLLTAGVDLSVGSIMFVAAAVAGKLTLSGTPLPLALAVIVLIGILAGLINTPSSSSGCGSWPSSSLWPRFTWAAAMPSG